MFSFISSLLLITMLTQLNEYLGTQSEPTNKIAEVK